MAFSGKVFAVTGGASGIGLATAKLIASRGGTVCISDVDKAALDKAEAFFTEKTPTTPFMVTQVDVSKRDQVESWIAAIKEKHGRLDGAANIAGVIGKDHGIKPVAELDDLEWHKIIGVNLTGLMYCLRSELQNIEDGGSIVNMASIHATTGECPVSDRSMEDSRLTFPGMANHGAYAASKHGVLGLTRAAAKENGAREVRVNAVAPGPIYTPMMEKYFEETNRPADAPFDEPIAFRRMGTAEEVAQVVCFLLGPESTFVSGACYSVDGAWI